MKKIIGWILITCGILSLPGFLFNLTKAHDGYEVIGMFIGQGLIYYLAYICLKTKRQEKEPEQEQEYPNYSKSTKSPLENIDSQQHLDCLIVNKEDFDLSGKSVMLQDKGNDIIRIKDSKCVTDERSSNDDAIIGESVTCETEQVHNSTEIHSEELKTKSFPNIEMSPL